MRKNLKNQHRCVSFNNNLKYITWAFVPLEEEALEEKFCD